MSDKSIHRLLIESLAVLTEDQQLVVAKRIGYVKPLICDACKQSIKIPSPDPDDFSFDPEEFDNDELRDLLEADSSELITYDDDLHTFILRGY